MKIEHPTVTPLIDLPLGCGEGPTWDEETGTLLFVDIPAPALFRLDPATLKLERHDMPSAIGSFGLMAGGKAVVALKHGIHIYDFARRSLDLLCHPEPDRPTNRYNDGKVAPDGRFWVGTMDDRPERQPMAALYRVEADGRFQKILDGLTVSNGLAWSPDGRTLWHSDSSQKWVETFAYDLANGGVSNRRQVCVLENEDGRPDGAACDAEGFYWSAGVSAGCLNRIAPDGTLERKLVMPMPAPTMPCFGGKDLKTLYVTSLTTDRTGTKVAGTLVALASDVAGAPIARFGERLPGL
ncbi:SMP-30/gluconolactonase/LRE family protein [Prosthecomicrobium sp. N25]|uniref:SMP-30/gluconolactonase/LRE family protein n=1 Tax=Prosthecomicrobium sp. N25 TaxID=3129254 RepID=UPI00307880FC